MALAFLLGVGAYRLLDTVRFFNNYVKNGYMTTVVTDLEKLYTPASLFIIILLIILLIMAILILLVHKKKPAKLYIMMVIYYLLIFIGLFYISGILQSFEKELLSSTLSRSLRDVLVIVYIPQFIFIVFILLRTIGFNVKKFEFADERQSMDSDSLDNEEFEINVNFQGYRFKQKINRTFREIIYYIKENKFIVICVLLALSAALAIYIYNNIHSNYDLTYRTGKSFTYNKLNITVEDAVITNLDYQGNTLDNYYLVLKVKIKNTSGYAINVDYNNFKLEVGRDTINPTINDSVNFIDYAPSNVPLSISHNSDKTFALAYKLNVSQTRKGMHIKIHNGNVYDKGEYIDKRIFININPKRIADLNIVGNYKLYDKISFEDTYLGNSEITFNSYFIDKKYIYKYEVCAKEECKEYYDAITIPIKDNRYDNKLIILSVDYLQDVSTAYNSSYNSLASFAENFVKVQYKVGDKVYSDAGKNVTPLKVSNLIAFEVPNEIENANIIQIIITIRNKEYIINLKVIN